MTQAYLISALVLVIGLVAGASVGAMFARQRLGSQLLAIRAEAARNLEVERARLENEKESAFQQLRADHEALAANIRESAANSVEALNRSHAETLAALRQAHGEATAALQKAHADLVSARDAGAGTLIESYEERLRDATAEKNNAVGARELLERELAGLNAQFVTLQAKTKEQKDQFEADRAMIEARLGELIQTAAAKALNDANSQLLDQNAKQFTAHRAETMKSVEVATKPLTEGIVKLQNSVLEFDKQREAGAEALKATLEAMARNDDQLRQTVERSTTETAKLSTALRDNRVRGRWGEIGLRNVLDKVGLTPYCDFVEQAGNEDGRRPDVLVKLPGDRGVAVDSKVPFESYMKALEATDPLDQQRFLEENASVLRSTVHALAAKGYHRTEKSIGVTILYVQIESVVSAALTVNPGLIEEALGLGIVISSPATLLAYLRAFSREWKLQQQNAHAKEIAVKAHELIERLVKFAGLFALVGTKLDASVKAWNDSVGSFDARLVVTARDIAALSGTELTADRAPQVIETARRDPQNIPELEAAGRLIALPSVAAHQQQELSA